MKKITVREEALVSIKKGLDRIPNYLDSLLNLIEAGLVEKDWRLIKKISASHNKCSKAINHILKSKGD